MERASVMTIAEPSSAISVPDTDVARGIWHVGTLQYTRRALALVFFWMLWGDFCLTIMESVIPRLVPLQLKDAGASSLLIGALVTSIPSGMNFIMNPIISTRSDRHRSRLGRRMPFLLWPTPALTICLILLGFSGSIASGLHYLVAFSGNFISVQHIRIAVIGLLMVCFSFFNLFITTVYYYLFADIIPQQVMGKFTCLFRVVGAVGGIVFNWWMLGYADIHSRAIYVGAGLLYLVAFLSLVRQVKEGEYPPPPPLAQRKSVLAAIKKYGQECFSKTFYQKLYAIAACFWAASIPFNTFVIFYATKTLGLKLEQFGAVLALAGMATIPLFFVMGPIIDRFHPIRTAFLGLSLMAASAMCGFLFVHDYSTFRFWILIFLMANAVYIASNLSLLPRLLPRIRYGQFSSANAMVNAIALILAPLGCGFMLDKTGDWRYVFIWAAVWSVLGAIACFAVYVQWKNLGGDLHYSPPEDGLEKLAA